MNKQSMENYTATFNRFMEDGNVKNPNELHDILKLLHRYEAALTRFNEIQCEREMTEEELKRESHVEEKVKEIAAKLGFNMYFNGDPRGFAIRFYLPSKRYNSWDGETWALNW